MNINWLESDSNKITKLKLKLKLKKTELETKLTEGETIKTAKEVLKKENKFYEDKISKIGNEIVELENEKSLVIKDYKDLENNALSLYNNYINVYNPKKKLTDWTNSIEKKKGFESNLIEITMNGEKFNTVLDELDTIAGVVAYQLGKIKTSDFNSKIGNLTSNVSKQNTLKTLFARLKSEQFEYIYPEKSSDVNDTREFYMLGSELDYTIDENNKKVDKTIPTPLFPFREFFALVLDIAPRHDLSFIESLNNSDIIQKTTFSIVPAGRELTETEKKDYDVKLKSFFYPDDISKAKKKEIQNGLKDWILLFYDAYVEPISRHKCVVWMEGDSSESIGVNPYESLIMDLKNGGDIDNNYSYERDRPDGVGKEKVYCINNIPRTITDRKLTEQQLENKKNLKNTELIEQNKLYFEHQKKISVEDDKIAAKSAEIQILVDAEIVAKQTEIDKTDFTKSDFEWTSPTNILKAAAAKQMLIDIRFLENDGDDTKPLKNAKNQQVWDAIETNQGNNTGWNSVIKTWFEGKGTDLASRIAKVKEEAAISGIGLEIIRECYAAMDDTAVVEAIDKELAPTPVPTTKLTKEDLGAVLGIADATDEMVTKWESLVGDWGKKKENIEGVVKAHTSDATKKGKLIEHIKKLPDSDGIDKTSDDTILSSFFKKEPKFIIETIVAHELDDNAVKVALIVKMKGWKSTDGKNKLSDDYLDSDGEPTEAGMKKFLYEEKLGQSYSTKAIDTQEEENGTPTDEKGAIAWLNKNYWWPVWVPIVLIVGGVAIFWKNISEWWNGPAEEEGGKKTEGDKEEEENE